MGLWILYLAFALVTPGTMLLFGWLWKKHPPQDVNCVYGYRTKRSSQSPEAWAFAQAYMGKIWRFWGGVILALTALAFPLGSLALCGWRFPTMAVPEQVDPVSWLLMGISCVQLVALIGSIFPVEQALKRSFDSQGKPKRKE